MQPLALAILATVLGASVAPEAGQTKEPKEGSCAKEDILSVMSAHANEVRFCYELRLQENPKLAGSVLVSFTIGSDGAVRDTAVKENDIQDDAVAKCIVRRLIKWKFPAPKGGGTCKINYPWRFVAAEDKAEPPARRFNPEPEKVVQLQTACDQGQVIACAGLAGLYQDGDGVKRDANRALLLYRRACDGGLGGSCALLGRMYKQGIGTAKDPAKAAELQQRACDMGDLVGCSNLAAHYEGGLGVKKDEPKAAEIRRRTCEAGMLEECYLLGDAHEHGWHGVSKDVAKAKALYRKACAGTTETIRALCSTLPADMLSDGSAPSLKE